jgi:hypothetical protein
MRAIARPCRIVSDDGAKQNPVVTDGWKLALLDILCLDYYFQVVHVHDVLRALENIDSKIAAAVRIFSRVTNPEDWHVVLESFSPRQQDAILGQLGVVSVFNPKNPTGHYRLQLSNQVQYLVANRLLELYRQQEANGYCAWPKKMCFSECTLDGKELDVSNAHKFSWPQRCGELVLSFVDLTPVPCMARPMTMHRFTALRSMVLNNRVCP